MLSILNPGPKRRFQYTHEVIQCLVYLVPPEVRLKDE